MGLVIQQVGQIAEQLLGGTGVETLASSFADGVGSIAFRGILCGIEEFMVVLSVSFRVVNLQIFRFGNIRTFPNLGNALLSPLAFFRIDSN